MDVSASIIGNTTRQFSAQNYFNHQGHKNKSLPNVEVKKFESGDIVEFSANVPKAFTEKELSGAEKTAEKIIEDSVPSVNELKLLRNDRVYAALVKLEMMNIDPEKGRRVWPMGIPTPSKDELEEAYSRLTQHINLNTKLDDKEHDYQDTINEKRVDLLEQFRMYDFDSFD